MKYCDNTLITSPIQYGLVTSQKQYEKELKQLKVPKPQWGRFVNEGKGATVTYLENDAGQICIVGIDVQDYSIEQIYAMLVHEAVHIWQEIKRDMGEREPSSEFEAYSIQGISQNLMESYRRLTEK